MLDSVQQAFLLLYKLSFSGICNQTRMTSVCLAIGNQLVVAGPKVAGLTLQIDVKSCSTSVKFNDFACTVQII